MICDTCIYVTSRHKFLSLMNSDGQISTSSLRDNPCCYCKYLFDCDYYEAKLKRCPFCGGEAFFITDDGGDSGKETYSVSCSECGCDIGWYDTKKEASAAWNRRST